MHDGYARGLGIPTVPGVITVDPLSETPPYVQIADQLRELIRSGKIARGQPIPSVHALIQQTGVAKNTASKAVRVLKDEGLVGQVPGRGVYVK